MTAESTINGRVDQKTVDMIDTTVALRLLHIFKEDLRDTDDVYAISALNEAIDFSIDTIGKGCRALTDDARINIPENAPDEFYEDLERVFDRQSPKRHGEPIIGNLAGLQHDIRDVYVRFGLYGREKKSRDSIFDIVKAGREKESTRDTEQKSAVAGRTAF